MHNLIEYSSNYSETARSLQFYSKDEGNNFNVDIASINNFKSFKYKAKLSGNIAGQPAANAADGILKNATIAVSLKYLSNFWRSLEMPLINCKVELKLKWKKYCVFSQMVMIMKLPMLIMLIELFLLLKTQNYMFLQ